VLALLRIQAVARAVVFVTHNQRHARVSGGLTVLLAGGRVLDSDATPRFFTEPQTDTARRFLVTGGSLHPRPGGDGVELDDGSEAPTPLPASATAALARTRTAPNGFFWVVQDRLGGLPRPGILSDLTEDLAGLQSLGVTLLVTLEEAQTVDPHLLAAIGVESLHFPVPDMRAPALGPTVELCATIEARIARGAVVAFHCLAGLGRTGTLLASQLVWQGETALRAIERVRQISPLAIQSDEQARFVRAFEDAVRPRVPGSSRPPVVAQ
jgi:atypical dual specificity phosphatase